MPFPAHLTDGERSETFIWTGDSLHVPGFDSLTWNQCRLSAPHVIKLKFKAHKMPPGPGDNGPMHINYRRNRMAYDKQQ